jgi:uncharacterized protein (DUF169 family)
MIISAREKKRRRYDEKAPQLFFVGRALLGWAHYSVEATSENSGCGYGI